MNYIYDAVIERDEDGYSVSFPQIPGAATFGETREEAARRAAEVLAVSLADRIEDGEEVPTHERVAEGMAVGADVTGA